MTARTFKIEGMHCQSCMQRLTAAFSKVPGVSAAHVTLTPPEAHLQVTQDVPTSALQAAAREAGDYTVSEASPASHSQEHVHPSAAADADGKPPSLYPLILIVAYIAGSVLLIGWARARWEWHSLMLDFMAGFFLVFSFFKLLDLRGFADAYQSYDVIARRSRGYAFVYPFLELGLGIAYLVRWQPTITNGVTLALMLVGSVGVLRAVLDKRRIRCACLGTALNLPMTTVTVVEDLGMAAMAALALLWPH
jgi:copper chaperone CopZ